MTQIITTSSTTAGNNVAAGGVNEFIFIAEGVTRASTGGLGLTSGGFGGTEVHALGSLVGTRGIHLFDNADAIGDYRVTVGATGSVTGMDYAIFLQDSNNRVANQGEVSGILIGVYSSGDDFRLANSGVITGHGNDGVLNEGAAGDVVNHGLIQTLGAGPSANAVDFFNAGPGGVSKLANFGTLSAAGGVAVRGDSDSVDEIRNFGLVNGDVDLGGGSDFFRNGGEVVGSAVLGTGSDLFKGRGGSVEGDILGGGGNDTINGGVSDNLIAGGAGVDRMTGGADADTFDFNNVTESGVAAADRDTITDFEKGLDLIDLRTIDADTTAGGNQAFSFIGASAFSAPGEVRAVQQGGNTLVQVSNDGDNGAETAIILRGLHTLAAADFLL